MAQATPARTGATSAFPSARRGVSPATQKKDVAGTRTRILDERSCPGEVSGGHSVPHQSVPPALIKASCAPDRYWHRPAGGSCVLDT